MSVWNPENVIDAAETIGISSLDSNVQDHLARDVEFRISQVLIAAIKFMRHAKRTTLTTQDVSQALRLLGVEPLYGYESTRPLKFGEASIGPGQPLFYIEDEEMDFEKLINAPLPKVPREIGFTGHWLALEGVQPSIPQNPTRDPGQETVSKGHGTKATLAALSGQDNVAVKPLVKHVLSKELQLYFERVCTALLDESNDEFRLAALSSLQTDPGIHQLVPYFVQFIADKVTHNLKNIQTLIKCMQMVYALLKNEHMMLSPYAPAIVPSVLTCAIGKRLGGPNDHIMQELELRKYAADLLGCIAQKYGTGSSTLKPRIARSCMKNLLDRTKPLGTHYGAILGLQAMAGATGVRMIILPSLPTYDLHLGEALQDEARSEQAGYVVDALLEALQKLEKEAMGLGVNGYTEEQVAERLNARVGRVLASRIQALERPRLVEAVLEEPM
ncbi:DUF1546-domain-containing protein [Piedraia hortae CBS 480.64]|uniref:TBP-associated factor 6 n=1 Tax=Piedraia hortae CBS 480.64 TaxID=1314780 RepID=A0A6A7BXP4_9PEZI|nr:DUF1546-domain-containing protein [Piedraia hortae CBS 480.64]